MLLTGISNVDALLIKETNARKNKYIALPSQQLVAPTSSVTISGEMAIGTPAPNYPE